MRGARLTLTLDSPTDVPSTDSLLIMKSPARRVQNGSAGRPTRTSAKCRDMKLDLISFPLEVQKILYCPHQDPTDSNFLGTPQKDCFKGNPKGLNFYFLVIWWGKSMNTSSEDVFRYIFGECNFILWMFIGLQENSNIKMEHTPDPQGKDFHIP